MSEQTVLEFLKDAITSMTDDDLDLSPTTKVADIGLESLDYVDLLERVEKRYGIKLIGHEVTDLGKGSLGDTARFILARTDRR